MCGGLTAEGVSGAADSIYTMANELVLFPTQTHCPLLFSYELEGKEERTLSAQPSLFVGAASAHTFHAQQGNGGSLHPNPQGSPSHNAPE